MEITVRTYPDDDEREYGKLCTILWDGPPFPALVCHGGAAVVVAVISCVDMEATAALPRVLHPSESRLSYDLLDEGEKSVVDFCASVGALRMFRQTANQMFFDYISIARHDVPSSVCYSTCAVFPRAQ